ncbi:MAG: hypothetical protein II007_11660 [Gammaproteobacteria bacterium]|nr:hypothetical protein [Gammaproteobacteria bacterium]
MQLKRLEMAGFMLVEQLIAALVAGTLLCGLARLYMALAVTNDLQRVKQQLQLQLLSSLEGESGGVSSPAVIVAEYRGRRLDSDGHWRDIAATEAPLVTKVVSGTVASRDGELAVRLERWQPRQLPSLMLLAAELDAGGG